MKEIITLPPELISKIAAGEVVERPASIIKELVENSLDAGAEHISINLEGGGIKKISVQDDGKGMNIEDALVSFLPHTTSKISSEEDLVSIKSFGFRGEALSSIAAVSTMTIKTRTHDAGSGIQLELEGGKLIDSFPCGMPSGTEIIIESLFNSVPARKKFLKDPSTELRQCVDIVVRLALSYPEVGFILSHEGKTLINVPHHQHLKERIENILDNELSLHLISISHSSDYGSISGFISTPQGARHTRQDQYVFINKRSVNDPKLSAFIKESYGSLLEARAHPPFIISLSLPYDQVDVNIHPRKEEVAFAFPQKIYELIQKSIEHSLTNHNLTYSLNSENNFNKDTSMDWHMAEILKSIVSPWSAKSGLQNGEILQIHNIYLFAAVPEGLLIADQHAVHERILFEQFKDAYLEKRLEGNSYIFTKPELFDLSSSHSLALESRLPLLRDLGFDIELFGHHTFKLSAVPEFFKNRNLKKLIIDLMSDTSLQISSENVKMDRETERTLAYLACRSALKAGEALTQDECKNLIRKLLEMKRPYTCPHGRPTHIIVSLKALDKMFKRI